MIHNQFNVIHFHSVQILWMSYLPPSLANYFRIHAIASHHVDQRMSAVSSISSIQRRKYHQLVVVQITIQMMFCFPNSGESYYYRLDKNNTVKNKMLFDAYDSIKFLVHGYTDRVQFNRTGKSLGIFSNFVDFQRILYFFPWNSIFGTIWHILAFLTIYFGIILHLMAFFGIFGILWHFFAFFWHIMA